MFDGAAEVILWAFGIQRKRAHDNADGSKDADGWEIHPWHLCGTVTGLTLGWWAFWKYDSYRAAPGGQTKCFPRIGLSQFLRLLREGSVIAVTYVADRPPSGSLIVRRTLSGATPAASQLPLEACPTIHANSSTVETLLLPGCHQSVFEELRASNIFFECAEATGGEVESDCGWLSLLVDVAGLLVAVAGLAYLFRGSNQNSSFTARRLENVASGNASSITFDDVAGMENTKEELREVIAYLRDPVSFYALGAHPPRGILLAGPSGTGKTLLARAVAGEAGTPFFYASAAAFVEIYVGQGAQRIRQFFDQARNSAPCIVFIDELDAVGSTRRAAQSGGDQEYVQTLNQLLVELDGVESQTSCSSTGAVPPVVVTMAATNRYDCLDEALVRPGRLDRIVLVHLPNFQERIATLKIHAAKLRHEGLNYETLARRTAGWSGADLANLLNESALLAARRRATAVSMMHIDQILCQPRPQKQQESQSEPANTPELLSQMFAMAMGLAARRATAEPDLADMRSTPVRE